MPPVCLPPSHCSAVDLKALSTFGESLPSGFPQYDADADHVLYMLFYKPHRDGNHRAVTLIARLLQDQPSLADHDALGKDSTLPERVMNAPARDCSPLDWEVAGHTFDFSCLVDVKLGLSSAVRAHVVENELFCPDPGKN